ncbi:hypothetical protein [Phyllobacterium zundukense]
MGEGDILHFSHGGVGTLFLCDLMSEPISRKRGQPISGCCCFAFEAETRTLIHGWQDIGENELKLQYEFKITRSTEAAIGRIRSSSPWAPTT